MLIEAIGYYAELGLKPFFLNHEGDEDGALITRVNAALKQPIPVVTEADPLAVKGIIRASEAVLCSRYHGCISAMSEGIACIGTSWSHKYELLYNQYGADALLLQPETSTPELKNIIDLSLQKDNDLSKALEANALLLKTESAALWDHIQSIVDGYSPFSEGATS
jgi:colanic acid/amylovoran biosynthesis protein